MSSIIFVEYRKKNLILRIFFSFPSQMSPRSTDVNLVEKKEVIAKSKQCKRNASVSNFFRENVTLILPCLTSIIPQVRIYSHWYYKHNQEDNCNISRKIANYCNWCTPFLTSRWHNHCHRNIWNHLIFPSLGCYFVVSTCKSCKKRAFF